MSNIIDGKAVAKKLEQRLTETVNQLKIKPKVVSILIGDDPPSVLYTNMKQKKAQEIGIDFQYMKFPEDIQFQDISLTLIKLNQDPTVNGIMVQLPLPEKFLGDRTTEQLLQIIDPKKDVDGLTGKSKFLPAAVQAVMSILDEENIEVKDKFAVVLGTSKLVGLPIADELKKRGAVVSSVNSKTPNMKQITSHADIIVSATGVAGILTGEMVKEGVVVIDVGTLVIEDKIDDSPKKVVGDVDFESVSKKAFKITPVPGGVGPVTVIALMQNVVKSVQEES